MHGFNGMSLSPEPIAVAVRPVGAKYDSTQVRGSFHSAPARADREETPLLGPDQGSIGRSNSQKWASSYVSSQLKAGGIREAR